MTAKQLLIVRVPGKPPTHVHEATMYNHAERQKTRKKSGSLLSTCDDDEARAERAFIANSPNIAYEL